MIVISVQKHLKPVKTEIKNIVSREHPPQFTCFFRKIPSVNIICYKDTLRNIDTKFFKLTNNVCSKIHHYN